MPRRKSASIGTLGTKKISKKLHDSRQDDNLPGLSSPTNQLRPSQHDKESSSLSLNQTPIDSSSLENFHSGTLIEIIEHLCCCLNFSTTSTAQNRLAQFFLAFYDLVEPRLFFDAIRRRCLEIVKEERGLKGSEGELSGVEESEIEALKKEKADLFGLLTYWFSNYFDRGKSFFFFSCVFILFLFFVYHFVWRNNPFGPLPKGLLPPSSETLRLPSAEGGDHAGTSSFFSIGNPQQKKKKKKKISIDSAMVTFGGCFLKFFFGCK